MTDAMGHRSWLSPPRHSSGPRWPPHAGNTPVPGTVSGPDGGGQHDLAHEAPRTHHAQPLPSPHLPALTPAPRPAASTGDTPGLPRLLRVTGSLPPPWDSPRGPFRSLAKRSDIPGMSLCWGTWRWDHPFQTADFPSQGWVRRSSVFPGESSAGMMHPRLHRTLAENARSCCISPPGLKRSRLRLSSPVSSRAPCRASEHKAGMLAGRNRPAVGQTLTLAGDIGAQAPPDRRLQGGEHRGSALPSCPQAPEHPGTAATRPRPAPTQLPALPWLSHVPHGTQASPREQAEGLTLAGAAFTPPGRTRSSPRRWQGRAVASPTGRVGPLGACPAGWYRW